MFRINEGGRVELAGCVVDASSSAVSSALELRCVVAGLSVVFDVDAPVPGDVPVLLVTRTVAPLSVYLGRNVRLAPTFVCMLGPESDLVHIELLARGVTDVFFSEGTDDLSALVAHLARYREVQALAESALVTKKFGGSSLPWRKALHELVAVARADCSSLLISGETGTGKDGAARLVHDAGRVQSGEFVIVHCGAIVSTLSGSELFGHRRGAFSGADRDRDGAVARANGGTLFLDEVAELTPALQTELLRVLQDGTYKPVGEDRERVSRFRVVAATHKQLKEQVARGSFREDLYFRLCGTEVYLPPLRERRTDVPELIARFAAEFLGEGVTVDAAIERALQQHPFPGNVRELKGLVRAACARCPDGKTLRLACLPAPVLNNLAKAPAWSMSDLDVSAEGALVAGVTFNDFVDAAKDSLVRAALGLARGSVKEAAQRLSVSERCVQLRRRAERASGAPPAQEGDETLEVAS